MQHPQAQDLGFDDWFQERRDLAQYPEFPVARVTAVDRARYLVRNEFGEVPAEATGKLLYSAESSLDLPCVGDWVYVQYHDSNTLGIIHDRFPRKSVLRRKSAGKKIEYQLIASNIDVAFVVQSCEHDFNLRRLERYLAMVTDGGIKPVILLSKTDLISREELDVIITEIAGAGITHDTISLSSITRYGIDKVQQMLVKTHTYCLIGSSGVGKTTLINHLFGQSEFETKAVRQKDGKGRHATTRRHLIVLDNGAMVIDNPGMRELGVISISVGMADNFSDIIELSAACHFGNCSHTGEAGCALLLAIESGELSNERYQNYLKLISESEYHEMSYFEKRQKDKEFGKHVKSVMKHKKKSGNK